MKRNILLAAFAAATLAANAQSLYFPFDGNVTESVSKTGSMTGVRTLPYASGVKGQAVRFDGYSNYVTSTPTYTGITPTSMTLSLWLAPETYPMMNTGKAETTPTYAMVAGNLDAAAKTGIGLMLSSQGGYKITVAVYGDLTDYEISNDIIPLGQWSNIVVTMSSNKINVYRNGQPVTISGGNNISSFNLGSASFFVGKSREDLKSDYDNDKGVNLTTGLFNVNTFNGLIDELRIDNDVKDAATIAAEYAAANTPAIASIPVISLLTENNDYGYLRPQFHGMPAKGWTNESHGLIYYNGKYHLFFQKNGNGPYMARLHWGHITSTDLLNWAEEPVAIAPGASKGGLEANDGKGCWSGCIFTDDAFNNGKPTILYTGVSNAKAFIWMAAPKDDNLLTWEKTPGQIIASQGNPCCSDASDDFRDPYFFTANGNKYIIIGTSNTSKVGTCLLYKYNGSSWDYQGLFFSGSSQASCGRFWEMPNVTDLGNGKYLFTCTPLETSTGVKTLYWIGTIGTDGKFTPEQKDPMTFEAEGTSKDGYGLLSPTIYNNGGKLIALGIVPDKVATEINYNWGWAHNYSLPRELTIGTDPYDNNIHTLIQKPLSAVATSYRGAETTNGRQIEMTGTFTFNSTTEQGFKFLMDGDNYAKLSVTGSTLTLDLTNLKKTSFVSDYYTFSASNVVKSGQTLTVDAILDGSIIDVFFSSANAEGGAFSARLFPTDQTATTVETLGSGTNVKIYSLNTTPCAIEAIQSTSGVHPEPVEGSASKTRKCMVNGQLRIVKGNQVFSLSGARIK